MEWIGTAMARRLRLEEARERMEKYYPVEERVQDLVERMRRRASELVAAGVDPWSAAQVRDPRSRELRGLVTKLQRFGVDVETRTGYERFSSPATMSFDRRPRR